MRHILVESSLSRDSGLRAERKRPGKQRAWKDLKWN